MEAGAAVGAALSFEVVVPLLVITVAVVVTVEVDKAVRSRKEEAIGKITASIANAEKAEEGSEGTGEAGKKEERILDEWAEEYGVPQQHQTDEGKDGHWKKGNHTHIYGKHVPYDSK